VTLCGKPPDRCESIQAVSVNSDDLLVPDISRLPDKLIRPENQIVHGNHSKHLCDRKLADYFHKRHVPLRYIKVSGEIELSTWETLLSYLISVILVSIFIRQHTFSVEFTGIKSDQHMGNTPYSEFVWSKASENHRNQPL
jgi:hypothetical protein